MHDTCNMPTRWAIALQNFDFTVKHVAGKLNVVPDALSRLFGEVEEEPLTQEPVLGYICLNVSSDRPYGVPGRRDFQVSSQNIGDVDIVYNDDELFASAVSLFPFLDPECFLKEHRAEFGPYIDYMKALITVAVPDGESKSCIITKTYFLVRTRRGIWENVVRSVTNSSCQPLYGK